VSQLDPAAPAGEWWLTGPVEPRSVIAGEEAAWSTFFIWGNRKAWGDGIFELAAAWPVQVAWDDDVTWSNRVVWGENVVWGHQDEDSPTVWGAQTVWGERIVWGE
jgi:hypothetical protein